MEGKGGVLTIGLGLGAILPPKVEVDLVDLVEVIELDLPTFAAVIVNELEVFVVVVVVVEGGGRTDISLDFNLVPLIVLVEVIELVLPLVTAGVVEVVEEILLLLALSLPFTEAVVVVTAGDEVAALLPVLVLVEGNGTLGVGGVRALGTIRFEVGTGTFTRLLVLKGGLGGRATEGIDLRIVVLGAKDVGLLVIEEVGVREPVDLEVEATGGVEILEIGRAGGSGRGERIGVLFEVVDSPVEEEVVAFEGFLDIVVDVLPLLLDLLTEAAGVADCRDVVLVVAVLGALVVEVGGDIAEEVVVVVVAVEVEVEAIAVAAGRFTGLTAFVRGVTVEGVLAVERMIGDRRVEGVVVLFSVVKVVLLLFGVIRKPVLEVETGGRLLIACKSSSDTSISVIYDEYQYIVRQ